MPSEVEVKSELYLDPPSEELLSWARKNIREEPDTRCQKLEEFRDLIYERGECTPHRTDDAFLLRFLRSRKFCLERAHRLLVSFYEWIEDSPHFVEGVGFEVLEKVGVHDLISVPPYRDQVGQRILLYKLGKWVPEKVSMDNILSASWLILELAILEPQSQMKGGICIIDCEGITMQHALHMSHSVAYKIFQMIMSHPMKLEAMHIINHSWMFESFFTLFRPFLHEKMKERLHFHGDDMESLHKHVDPKCLPQVYGGAHPNYSHTLWVDYFRSNNEIIKELTWQNYSVP